MVHGPQIFIDQQAAVRAGSQAGVGEQRGRGYPQGQQRHVKGQLAPVSQPAKAAFQGVQVRTFDNLDLAGLQRSGGQAADPLREIGQKPAAGHQSNLSATLVIMNQFPGIAGDFQARGPASHYQEVQVPVKQVLQNGPPGLQQIDDGLDRKDVVAVGKVH